MDHDRLSGLDIFLSFKRLHMKSVIDAVIQCAFVTAISFVKMKCKQVIPTFPHVFFLLVSLFFYCLCSLIYVQVLDRRLSYPPELNRVSLQVSPCHCLAVSNSFRKSSERGPCREGEKIVRLQTELHPRS